MKTKLSLAKYDNPPVDEVVFGITFEPLHLLKIPYIGLFWERIRKEFPRCEQAPFIGDPTEFLDPELGFAPPRVWLINAEDDHLVQLQKNKFLFNWRKRGKSYPSFEPVHQEFLKNLNTFKSFIAEYELGDLDLKVYELSYFNIIPQNDRWKSLNDIKLLFPDLCWRKNKDRFLKDINGFNWNTVFNLPNDYGKLTIQLQNALRMPAKIPVMRLEITVRGFYDDISAAGMKDWFDTAHEWIVRSFEDITDENVQREVWKKHEHTRM